MLVFYEINVYLSLEEVPFSNTDNIISHSFLLCMIVNFCYHLHILEYSPFNLDTDILQILILQQLDKVLCKWLTTNHSEGKPVARSLIIEKQSPFTMI